MPSPRDEPNGWMIARAAPPPTFRGWSTLRVMSDSTPTATPTTPTPPAPPRLPKRRALALLASYPVAVARAAASPQVRPLVGLVLF